MSLDVIRRLLEKRAASMMLSPNIKRSSKLFGKLKQDRKLGVSLMDATKVKAVSPSTTPSGFRSGSDRFYKMASAFVDELHKLGAIKPYTPIRGTRTPNRMKQTGTAAMRTRVARDTRLEVDKTDKRRKYAWEKKTKYSPTEYPKKFTSEKRQKGDKPAITPWKAPTHEPKDYSPPKPAVVAPEPKPTPKPEVAKPQSWYQRHKGKLAVGAGATAGLAGLGVGAAGLLRGAAKSAERDAKTTQYAPSGYYA